MRMEIFLQKADVGGVGVIDRAYDVSRLIQPGEHIKIGQMITDRILINDMSDHIIGNELPVWMLFTVQQNAIPVDP